MFLVGLLSWWYSGGLSRRVYMIKNRIESAADFFSIGLLVSTLFAPYKQISAQDIGEELPQRLRAFFDKSLSRVIGFCVRSFMIIIGLILILIQSIFGLIVLISWVIMPLVPVIGLILMMSGWVPNE